MDVTTTQGLMDDSLLKKTELTIENDREHTTSIEYCLAGCRDPVHIEGSIERQLRILQLRVHEVTFLCKNHVHRSAHVMLK